MLLPKRDKELMIDHIHRRSNQSDVAQTSAQVRHRYWIPQRRSVVKRGLNVCTVCRRWEGGPYEMPPITPLPRERVKEAVPFSHSEIDYFGPMYVTTNTGTQKLRICFFYLLFT